MPMYFDSILTFISLVRKDFQYFVPFRKIKKIFLIILINNNHYEISKLYPLNIRGFFKFFLPKFYQLKS